MTVRRGLPFWLRTLTLSIRALEPAGGRRGRQGCDGKKRDDYSSVVVVNDGWGQMFSGVLFRVAQTFQWHHSRCPSSATLGGADIREIVSSFIRAPLRDISARCRIAIFFLMDAAGDGYTPSGVLNCRSSISWACRRLKKTKKMQQMSKTTGIAAWMLLYLCAPTGIPKSQRRVEGSALCNHRQTDVVVLGRT